LVVPTFMEKRDGRRLISLRSTLAILEICA
jgi:hypothetical protein